MAVSDDCQSNAGAAEVEVGAKDGKRQQYQGKTDEYRQPRCANPAIWGDGWRWRTLTKRLSSVRSATA
jgi:hypothetical protein